MIIFGTRRVVHQLAMIVLTCGNCHRGAAHALLKAVTKFTLFFIPLFPVRTRYVVQCTACGASGQIDKERAEGLQASAEQPPGPPAGPPAGPPYPGQPYPGQPSYPAPPSPPGPQAQPGYRSTGSG